MIKLSEYPDLVRQVGVLALLVGLLCAGLVYQFTSRSAEAAERERAHIMLHRIYELEEAHFAQSGTYFKINRETHGDVLQLNDAPGRFRYRVDLTADGFVAYAEGDLDLDGIPEIWRVGATQPDPVCMQQD